MGNSQKSPTPLFAYVHAGKYERRETKRVEDCINIYCNNKLNTDYTLAKSGFVWIKSPRDKSKDNKVVYVPPPYPREITEIHVIKASTLQKEREYYKNLHEKGDSLIVIIDGKEGIFKSIENEEITKNGYTLLPTEEH